MRKSKFILISFCLVFCLFFLFGCKNNNNGQLHQSYEENLSEYRQNLFVCKTEDYLVTLTSGKRETNYIMDGKTSTLTDFGVITVKFEKLPASGKLQFELKVDADTYVGEFEINPFDNTFVYDISKQVSDESAVSLYLVEFDETLNLECLSKNWEVDYKEALNIFAEKHASEISENMVNKTLKGEIYIKTVAENTNLSDIYWYCLLVCESGEMYASLISVNTGTVVQNT